MGVSKKKLHVQTPEHLTWGVSSPASKIDVLRIMKGKKSNISKNLHLQGIDAKEIKRIKNIAPDLVESWMLPVKHRKYIEGVLDIRKSNKPIKDLGKTMQRTRNIRLEKIKKDRIKAKEQVRKKQLAGFMGKLT